MTRKLIPALIIICAAAVPAQADVDAYVGAFGGYGGSSMERVDDPGITARIYPRIDKHQHSFFGGAYAGAGWRFLAVEGGILKLPYYHASVDGLYPAREGNQTIGGSALYLRGLVRTPPSWGWPVAPYGFAGAAHVNATSREVVHCACYPGGEADFRAPLERHRARFYWGFGAEIPLDRTFSLRGEVGFIPAAVQSFWTGTRDYTLGSIALQIRF